MPEKSTCFMTLSWSVGNKQTSVLSGTKTAAQAPWLLVGGPKSYRPHLYGRTCTHARFGEANARYPAISDFNTPSPYTR